MKFLLVVFFLINEVWVEGKASEGWGAFLYETQEACLAGKTRAEGIHAQQLLTRPRSVNKRFECVADKTESTS
jgi:hypothetical protein